MYIPNFSTQELFLVLESLRSVAVNPEALTAREQQFLHVLKNLHEGRNDIIISSPVTLSHIAQTIAEPSQRQWLVQMGIIMALVEGKSTLPQLYQQLKKLRILAQVLSVKEPGLRVLNKVAKGYKLFASLEANFIFMSKFVVHAYQEEGLTGVKKIVSIFFNGNSKDSDLASKFHRLGTLAEDTLGYIFWKYFTEKNMIFPGETGAIPERFVFHDFGHILSGYNTDIVGEMLLGGFQAGYTRQNGFIYLLIVILHCHWGIKTSPMADSFEGLFDIPSTMHALQRGASCKVDLSDHWNFWEVVDIPLEKVRDIYGIPPLCPSSVPVFSTREIIQGKRI